MGQQEKGGTFYADVKRLRFVKSVEWNGPKSGCKNLSRAIWLSLHIFKVQFSRLIAQQAIHIWPLCLCVSRLSTYRATTLHMAFRVNRVLVKKHKHRHSMPFKKHNNNKQTANITPLLHPLHSTSINGSVSIFRYSISSLCTQFPIYVISN